MSAWYSYLLLVRPAVVRHNLNTVCTAAKLPAPTDWQLCQGVLRMWHRVIWRSDSVGTSPMPVRDNWLAKAFARKAVRGPALLFARAITPWDFTGLLSSPEQVIRHLLRAHHDHGQFQYDLELLACYRKLNELHAAVNQQLAAASLRQRWIADLCVFEHYHQQLLDETKLARSMSLAELARTTDDPDLGLFAYLRWCLAQPKTPHETLHQLIGSHDQSRLSRTREAIAS